MTTFLLTILFWATPPLPGLPLKQHPSFILSWRWYLRGRLGPFGRVPPHPSWVSPTCIRGIQWHAHLYIYWKRPWCWRRLKAKREEGGRGWDGWMVSATQRTWVWTPGDSEGQGSLACCSPWGRRVRHDLATEQQQYVLLSFCLSPTNPFSIGGEGLSQEHRRVERKLFFLPCSDKVGGVEMSC